MTEDSAMRGASATRRAALGGMAAIGASALLGRELTAQDATPVADPVAGLGAWGD